jgi:hypothetical protein
MKSIVWKDGLAPFKHDPNAVEVYRFDWSAWLEGDTITAAEAIPGDGMVATVISSAAGAVDVRVSGGVAGTISRVTCRVTTDTGRVQDRSIPLAIEER